MRSLDQRRVDEFVFRPIQEAILYARLRALLRLGEFHERVRRQNVQLRREMEMARSIQQEPDGQPLSPGREGTTSPPLYPGD